MLAIRRHLAQRFDGLQRRVQVPGQLGIMGFGDYEVARELNPGLTTIAVPTVRMGEEAARMLVQRLRHETPVARKRDLGFELIERGST